jgi:GT2 family glycosyltransferase
VHRARAEALLTTVVHAAVVTFNRRDLLVECLGGLLAQSHPVERILLVDNASTDGTAELLRERGLLDRPEIDYVRLDANRGSSGGFAEAVRRGGAERCDWLWLMDDDAEPEPDALERLLAPGAARDPRTAALCPAVVLPDGQLDLKHRGLFRGRPRPLPRDSYAAGHTARIEFFTWVGVLLRADAARAAGPPMSELFIWADDYEYSFRLRRHGELVLVPDSRVVHREIGQAYRNRRGEFWNRLMRWDYDPTPIESFWRNLCGVRNYLWVKKRYEGQSALSAAGTTAQFMLKCLLYDERPLRRLRWIARFARDGRRGVFRTITPPEWRAMVQRGEV